jgi:replicative DNA helicase
MSVNGTARNGRVHAADWKAWRDQALARLRLEDVYGDWMTGKQQGPGWLECRDPRSPTGDRDPSAGVADGTGDAERGTFKSFRPGDNDKGMSVFDFLVEIGRAEDYRAARQIIADLSGVPVPSGKPPRRENSTSANGKHDPAANGTANGNAPPATPYELNWISSAEFAAGNYRPQWLIEKIFVAHEPGFCGGPNKSLKTSVMVDCAISLGSATPFLRRYRVPRVVRAGMLSGESGKHALQQTALRVCEARGIALASADLFWEFVLPQLANLTHLAVLADSLRKQGIEVLLLDPLYLCLLSGNEAKGLQAGNLFDIGPLLLNVSKTCLDAGCTPFLIHHTKKNLSDPFQPLELNDMAFSGCAEFARQWILLNRRERYEPGTGEHRLWLNVGGSEGQSQLLAVNVDEGILEDDFSGRTWCVSCIDPHQAREQSALKNEQAKEEKRLRQIRNDASKMLAALEKLDPKGEGTTMGKLREKTGLGGDRAKRAIESLLEEEVIEAFQGIAPIGSGAQRKTTLYRHLKHKQAEEAEKQKPAAKMKKAKRRKGGLRGKAG